MMEPVTKLKANIARTFVALVVVLALVGTVFCSTTFAQDEEQTSMAPAHEAPPVNPHGAYGLIAAAVAFGLGAVGAGIAISHVGAAAMGAVAEKPQIAGQALVFVALAEGIVVFGFITALMILGKV